MRITHYRDLHSLPGYYNPTVAAHKEWQLWQGTPLPKSRGTIYRDTINQLFSPYTSLGSYTMLFTDDHCSTYCATCAKQEYFSGNDITCSTYDEGPTLYCDNCNTPIESSYGDPAEDKE